MLPRPAESLGSSVVKSVSPGCRSWPASYRVLQCSRPHVAAPSSSKATRLLAGEMRYGPNMAPQLRRTVRRALLGMRGKMIRNGRATRVGQGRAALPRRACLESIAPERSSQSNVGQVTANGRRGLGRFSRRLSLSRERSSSGRLRPASTANNDDARQRLAACDWTRTRLHQPGATPVTATSGSPAPSARLYATTNAKPVRSR